jgi:hypothetical protein
MRGQYGYTLLRFRDTTEHLTGIAEVGTAAEAISLVTAWAAQFPADAVVVFDPDQAPIRLAALARADSPAHKQSTPRGEQPVSVAAGRGERARLRADRRALVAD